MSRTPVYLILLLAASAITGCQFFPAPPQSDPDLDLDADSEVFVLPEINIESETIPNPEFILLFDIHRLGHITDPSQNMQVEDTLLLEVNGKGDYIYGFSENGNQLTTIHNGDCIQTCEGQVGYEVWGAIANSPSGCKLKVVITQFGQAGLCTSSCMMDFSIPWYSSVGDIALDEFESDLESLTKGVSREEVLGNMHWSSTYKLKGISGDINKNICEFEHIFFPYQ
jgi:hypothetical protein